MRLPISGPQLSRDRSFVLDREVGDAAARVEPVGRGKGVRRAGVEAGAAGAAMIRLRRVWRKLEVGQDRAEKEPGAEFARYEIGVLALPADAGARRERLFHERRSVDEHFDVRPFRLRRGDKERGERLQLAFDDVMIVAMARVDRDRAGVPERERRQRIARRAVVEAEHDEALGARHEPAGIDAALEASRHPGHVAMRRLQRSRR